MARARVARLRRAFNAFGAGMLHSMARRIGATITEVPASHALFMTQAKLVADVIDRAARHTSRATARAAR